MDGNLKVELTIPFRTEREANIAFNSLRVDKDPRRSGINRHMQQNKNTLNVQWEANEARVLRVSVNGFLDHLALVTQTIAEFGPPADNTDTRTNSCVNASDNVLTVDKNCE